MLKKKNEEGLFITVVLYGILSVASLIFLLYKNGLNPGDLFYYWLNTAYWCKGYSLETIMAEGFYIEQIGELEGVGILSYGRFMANILIPGFLPFNVAFAYNIITDIVVVILIGINTKKYLDNLGIYTSKKNVIMALFCLIFPWYWSGYIRTFNIGGTLALLCVLASFYIKDHENFAALLFALSLLKPQIGGIFLIALFLKKCYKLCAKITGIVIVSWIIDLIYIKNQSIMSSFVKIFTGYAGSDMEEERIVTWFLQYGIFNLLRRVGVPNGVVLLLSATAGIVFVFLLSKIINKNELLKNDYIIHMEIAALASLFWFYKSECDSLALLICNLLIFTYWKYSKKEIKDMIWMGGFLIGLNCLIGRYFLRFGIHLLEYDTGMFLDQVLQIVLFSILIIKTNKNAKCCS